MSFTPVLHVSAAQSSGTPLDVMGVPPLGPGPYVIPGPTATVAENSQINGLLIDWITLRLPVKQLPPSLQERLFEKFDLVACFITDRDGNAQEIRWETKKYNFDSMRSDSNGLFFSCYWVANVAYLYIGASPASIANETNVFGSLDLRAGAELLMKHAAKAFGCFLGRFEDWECQRLDITGNYALPDHAHVKSALRMLLQTDSARRKASSSKNGGDTVQWSPTSDMVAAKAYHKGPHLRYLQSKEKISISPELLALADRLLRLEMKLGARWFRRQREERKHRFGKRPWYDLTAADLALLHSEFFGPLVDGVEVRDMGRVQMINRIAEINDISQGRARGAYATYSSIKEAGLDEVRASMPDRTFYLHKKYLRAAGVSDADLCAGNVVQFRPIRIVLAQPVTCWDDIRRAA